MVFEIYGIEHTASSPAIRWKGTPTYHGVYLKPSYVEFHEIASPALIDWKVGDYVVYTRTGLTYKLYSVPQPTKKASTNGSGESFVYSNVQFYADTKQLEICPFRDLVYRDSAYYFSTLNAVSTYENVAGIALRIKKNLWDLYGDNSWNVVVAGGLPSSLNAGEAREFTVNGGSCLDALDQVYTVWPGLGWTFSVVGGTPTITIGGANVRTTANTTNLFRYGYENGLTMIKRTQSNLDTFCTRLYAYGSSRNMVSRYYNDLLDSGGQHIYEYQNVYIPNLMLPFRDGASDVWGKTGGNYDASKACLSNEDAIEVYGVIPKTVYFDGSEDEEIYPSIAKVTINNVRAALSPSDPYYPQSASSSRVDQVSSVLSQPTDSGLIGQGGSKYVEEADVAVSAHTSGPVIPGHHETILEYEYKLSEHAFSESGIANIGFQDIELRISTGDIVPDSVLLAYHIKSGDSVLKTGKITMTPDEEGTWFSGLMPNLTAGTKEYPITGNIEVWLQAEVDFPDDTEDPEFFITSDAGYSHWGLQAVLTSTFKIGIPQIGFDMMARAALSGTGNPVIAFTDGMLVGRSFTVKSATFDSYNDAWVLEVYRGEDSSVGMMYPNTSYPVAVGDHFVLLDIAMPDAYVGMAESRLLAAAKAKLNELSKVMPFYEPSVDAKQVLNNLLENPGDETYVLREGKYMHITDADVVLEDEYVIIDTLVISENESPVPTYKVTLRERKKESFQQSIESSIKSLTSVASAASKQTAAGGPGGGMSDEERTILMNLDSWFGKDPYGRIYVKKDESGGARDFYCFGEVTGGGITANNGGIAPSGMRAILIDGQPYISSDVQTPLDICAGSNVTITKNGNGRITIAANGGGSSVSWGSSGLGFAYLNVGGDSRKLITEHQDISDKITSPSTSGGAGKFLQWNGSAYVLASQAWREIKVNNVSFLAANVSNALNLIAGSNITLTRNTNGRVTISADDAGSSVSWGEEGSGYVNLSVDGTSKTLITEHQDVSDKITSPNTTGATGKFLQWGGSEYIFASQTWRAVNVGGESLLSGSNNTALNLVAGDNISLTRGTLGKVTIASTGLTQEQRTAIDNFIAWFDYDEETNSVFVRKDAQGNARNFYCFGEVTGGGITATGGGGGGTGDYDNLLNRPKINNVTLTGNMSLATLGIAAANHTHSQYLTASALDGYLPKTGGTLTGRLTINDAASYKPLILNTAMTDVASVRTEFQVRGTMVGQFEYGLDTEWLKLFISDGHGYGIAISGTNGGQSTYGRLLYIQNNAQREVYHSGNSNKNDVNWQGKDITAAGKFVGNKWYPSANDTAHYIEFVDGHWYIHGDMVCSEEITGGQITVNAS